MPNNSDNDKSVNTFAPSNPDTNLDSNKPSMESKTELDSKGPSAQSMDGRLGNLFQITKAVHQIELQLLESNGEITPEIEEYISAVAIAKERKVDAYAAISDRFASIEKERKKQADELYEMAKAAKRVQEHLKKNIKEAMIFMDVDELKGRVHRYKLYEPKEKVLILNEKEVPVGYCDVETVYTPNKERILDAHRSGIKVPGTTIELVHEMRRLKAQEGK